MSVITITCPKCGKVTPVDTHGTAKPGSGGRSCRQCHKLFTIYLDNKGNLIKAT